MTDATGNAEGEKNASRWDDGISSANGLLAKCFTSCDADPKGSVHRAWGISLIFVVVYFVVSILEMINLHRQGGSKALVIAAIWTGIVHLILAVLGTFVLKRFPTNFSVGFFLGVLLVLVNQNLILFSTFHGYSYGTLRTNNAFANLALALCLVLAFFTLLLVNFRSSVVVAPIDAKGYNPNTAGEEGDSYQRYEGSAET